MLGGKVYTRAQMEGKMGGGMMMRPTNYKKGSMIKARGGGLARTKPTKMY